MENSCTKSEIPNGDLDLDFDLIDTYISSFYES